MFAGIYLLFRKIIQNSIYMLGPVDNSDLDVPRLVRGIQFDLTLCNRLAHEARSLDPADKPRDVGAQKMNCQHALSIQRSLSRLKVLLEIFLGSKK